MSIFWTLVSLFLMALSWATGLGEGFLFSLLALFMALVGAIEDPFSKRRRRRFVALDLGVFSQTRTYRAVRLADGFVRVRTLQVTLPAGAHRASFATGAIKALVGQVGSEYVGYKIYEV